MIYEDFSIF
uniref:Uncharacterized protein n=1 Tax=Anguilla anguilla TaxID=7936 RepID=A0A0E9U5C9_ANGAN